MREFHLVGRLKKVIYPLNTLNPIYLFKYLTILRKDKIWKIIDGSGRKKNPIIPWNKIWDAQTQKGMKQKFSS